MKKCCSLLTFLLFLVFSAVSSCGTDNDTEQYTELSPVQADLTKVPYPKLSDYKFFEGAMKNLEPAYKVLPYDLNSALFTDYAHKKRFVWMPEGTQATYIGDGENLNFPTGAVLIKNFYYDNVQPGNVTKIIETRLMIKKATGWIFANYIWNDEQTEAFLNMNSDTKPITWVQGGETMSVNYTIPAESHCLRCHSVNDVPTPIGTRPQNLFKEYAYSTGTKNQLVHWKNEGYLNSVPASVVSTVNWEDTTKPLGLRARSYLDINCAHCHREGGDCDKIPLYFAFDKTENPANTGVCVEPYDFVTGTQRYIIEAQDATKSLLWFRMETNIKAEMMPPIGRSVTHQEVFPLLEEWIDSMEEPCP